MSEIPDDILKAALTLLGYEPQGPRKKWDKELVDGISTALLCQAIRDERERCARVGDGERDRHVQNYRNSGALLDRYYATAAENVASAIRAGA